MSVRFAWWFGTVAKIASMLSTAGMRLHDFAVRHGVRVRP